MKYRKTILTLGIAVLGCSAGAMGAGSPKRGVSENQFSVGAQMKALNPGVCWYYNWGPAPSKGYNNEVIDYQGMEFVPMCWNGNYDASKIREYVAAHPETKYLLGFNEPNFKNQANMTPAEAASFWPGVQALAKELDLLLVAPALNYSPDAPYQDPCRWMDEFVALVGPDAFDFTAVHSYGGIASLKSIATDFHDKYGKPVWVTEFCYWPGEQNGVSVTPAAQIASMTESLEWLETTEWIYRYAWFKAVGQSTATSGSPNFGLLQPQKGLTESFLSEQGNVYCYMPDFDPDDFHAVGSMFPAVDYISRQFATLGNTNDSECSVPIEIASFNSGATLDYLFNVPEAGSYDLTIDVCGIGEPERFDPSVKVQMVDGETLTDLTKAESFSLTDSDTEYREQKFTVTLPAGHINLRLADAAPYSPSGMRISRIGLFKEDTGAVNEIFSDSSVVNVYNLQGMPVRTNVDAASAADGLPSGVYIIGNKKIYIH